ALDTATPANTIVARATIRLIQAIMFPFLFSGRRCVCPTEDSARLAARLDARGSASVEQVLEPDHWAVRQGADPADREQHAGHERLAVDRVVADRERLADVAEDHLLMGDQAGQPDRMDGNLP